MTQRDTIWMSNAISFSVKSSHTGHLWSPYSFTDARAAHWRQIQKRKI